MYKVGASNKVPDVLSRRDEDIELQGITRPYEKNIMDPTCFYNKLD